MKGFSAPINLTYKQQLTNEQLHPNLVYKSLTEPAHLALHHNPLKVTPHPPRKYPASSVRYSVPRPDEFSNSQKEYSDMMI